MADMVATYGLDDSAFRRGLKSMESASERSGRTMEASWAQHAGRVGVEVLKGFGAFQLAKKMVLYAIDSVREYAKINDELRNSLEGAEAANKKFALSLGRDLAPLAKSVADSFSHIATAAVRYREAAVDAVADQLGGNRPGEAARARKWTLFGEEQQARFKHDQMMRRMETDWDIEEYRARGDSYAADLAEEYKRHDETIAAHKANKDPSLTQADRVAMQAAEERRHRSRLDSIDAENERRGRASLEARLAEQDQAREDAMRMGAELPGRFNEYQQGRARGATERADLLESLRIEQERLSGKKLEADIDAQRLELSRRIREIEADALLTDQEKVGAKQRLQDATAGVIRAMVDADAAKEAKAHVSRGRVLGAGFGDFAGQVFGGGRGGDRGEQQRAQEEKSQTGILKEAVATLKQIKDRLPIEFRMA